MISEEDNQPLLVHKISTADIYQRQGGEQFVEARKGP